MIDIYSWPTPNGVKIHITIEELGIPYNLHPVAIGKGEQFEEEFLKISPNNKIPAMVDPDGPDGKPYAVFESGAMMMYLAEKTGKLMPQGKADRYEVIQWLMFQMGGVGPMFGQYNHFNVYAPEKIEYGVQRYYKECLRLYGVLDRRLADNEWLAGGAYSIADIANFAWTYSHERRGFDIADLKHVQRWLEAINSRDAVQRGLALMDEYRRDGPPDKETLNNYFGDVQYQKR